MYSSQISLLVVSASSLLLFNTVRGEYVTYTQSCRCNRKDRHEVCGIDGKTYQSNCFATCSGIDVVWPGPCSQLSNSEIAARPPRKRILTGGSCGPHGKLVSLSRVEAASESFRINIFTCTCTKGYHCRSTSSVGDQSSCSYFAPNRTAPMHSSTHYSCVGRSPELCEPLGAKCIQDMPSASTSATKNAPLDCTSCVLRGFVWQLGLCLNTCLANTHRCHREIDSCESAIDAAPQRVRGRRQGEPVRDYGALSLQCLACINNGQVWQLDTCSNPVTRAPTGSTTYSPTFCPTNVPSPAPSDVPTAPTHAPSEIPTVSPTWQPTTPSPTFVSPTQSPSCVGDMIESCVDLIILRALNGTSIGRGINISLSNVPQSVVNSICCSDIGAVCETTCCGVYCGQTHAPSMKPSVSPSLTPTLFPTESPVILFTCGWDHEYGICTTSDVSTRPVWTTDEEVRLLLEASPGDCSAYTKAPVMVPTISPADTLSPSSLPTLQPTSLPTISYPTRSPSASLSSVPSSTPSTLLPTNIPSLAPITSFPSSLPSRNPTTSTPSVTPSDSPSSAAPTAYPTTLPTSTEPTAAPSTPPSFFPTSAVPTTQPSLLPTSSQPTTGVPTTLPSSLPSTQPSSIPSDHPATSMPTELPTFVPTVSPSISPTFTKSPTTTPSNSPTSCSDLENYLRAQNLPLWDRLGNCDVVAEQPGWCDDDSVRRFCPISCSGCPQWSTTLPPSTTRPTVQPTSCPPDYVAPPCTETDGNELCNSTTAELCSIPSVKQLCLRSCCELDRCRTAFPTGAPTSSIPTGTPSAFPSVLPSYIPSSLPSGQPTVPPSNTETLSPSQSPTNSFPTLAPSFVPSLAPSSLGPTFARTTPCSPNPCGDSGTCYNIYPGSECALADIMFLMDASSSVSVAQFENTKSFVQSVIRSLCGNGPEATSCVNIESSIIRVGVITFGSGAYLDLNFTSSSNSQTIFSDLMLASYVGGATSLGLAIQTARQEFTAARRSGRISNNVLVVVTDGCSSDRNLFDTEIQAFNTDPETSSTQRYVYAVGTDVCRDQLDAIAGESEVNVVPSFTFLIDEESAAVRNDICNNSAGENAENEYDVDNSGPESGEYDDNEDDNLLSCTSAIARNINASSTSKSPDHTYILMLDSPRIVEIDTCGSSFDTSISVYQSDGGSNISDIEQLPENSIPLLQNDDHDQRCRGKRNPPFSSLDSFVAAHLDAGIYVIVIGGYQRNGGSYRLSLYCEDVTFVCVCPAGYFGRRCELTDSPTSVPTSSSPTFSPTRTPSAVPSSLPTLYPTLSEPTASPTKSPSSSFPTVLPTSDPCLRQRCSADCNVHFGFNGVTFSPVECAPDTLTDEECAALATSCRLEQIQRLCPSTCCDDIRVVEKWTGPPLPDFDLCGQFGCSTDCNTSSVSNASCGWDRESNRCASGFITTIEEAELLLESSPGDCSHYTNAPSAFPTSGPSSVPSQTPTKYPSGTPSQMPTMSHPTHSPTDIPTRVPTAFPTRYPTRAPSFLPTSIPSSIPTLVPTGAPSDSPSGEPTSNPTSLPSYIPTALPTALPTVSRPTQAPTESIPTSSPTTMPTKSPTDYADTCRCLPDDDCRSIFKEETICGTNESHQLPGLEGRCYCDSSCIRNTDCCADYIALCITNAPSVSPTFLPSSNPSIGPTSLPSSSPSASPASSSPTEYPSSSAPSISPSNIPTSSSPSFSPTSSPSISPTLLPTLSEPSAAPSTSPTSSPTQTPTLSPSNAPTENADTCQCLQIDLPCPRQDGTICHTTTNHSLGGGESCFCDARCLIEGDCCVDYIQMCLTTAPTTSPSTLTPTGAPTLSLPTASPTHFPTGAPASSLPTTQPTSGMPTKIPTTAPSQRPSQFPSHMPSLLPTLPPSNHPTISFPTQYPSTTYPSFEPTTNPTRSCPQCVDGGPPASADLDCRKSLNLTAGPNGCPIYPCGQWVCIHRFRLDIGIIITNACAYCESWPPSFSPTERTDAPTSHPTSTPASSAPSQAPASSVPTGLPSDAPTNTPSDAPTTTPSAAPSTYPSRYPSPYPSILPSIGPSTSPSAVPSTFSHNPTVSVTTTATIQASSVTSSRATLAFQSSTNAADSTIAPTDTTFAPINVGSNRSQSPSVSPTYMPSWFSWLLSTAVGQDSTSTNQPAVATTITTSRSLVETPVPLSTTTSPTSIPISSAPTYSPGTSEPSEFPTSPPSSSSPTEAPSHNPTFFPTQFPSAMPTQSPTISPSGYPSDNPSVSPTEHPSQEPSHSPSLKPTLTPITSSPTRQPSEAPTNFPTASPTRAVRPANCSACVGAGLVWQLQTCVRGCLSPLGQNCYDTPELCVLADILYEADFNCSRANSTCEECLSATNGLCGWSWPRMDSSFPPGCFNAVQFFGGPSVAALTNEQCSVPPTMPPTTGSPSTSPSFSPYTSHPTMKPSTLSPTVSPSTLPPSVSPSEPPSTAIPTATPSVSPSTLLPSEQPSTIIPTISPSFMPSSSIPSGLPSQVPTWRPSTSHPTNFPSVHPTSIPTLECVSNGAPTPNPAGPPSAFSPQVPQCPIDDLQTPCYYSNELCDLYGILETIRLGCVAVNSVAGASCELCVAPGTSCAWNGRDGTCFSGALYFGGGISDGIALTQADCSAVIPLSSAPTAAPVTRAPSSAPVTQSPTSSPTLRSMLSCPRNCGTPDRGGGDCRVRGSNQEVICTSCNSNRFRYKGACLQGMYCRASRILSGIIAGKSCSCTDRNCHYCHRTTTSTRCFRCRNGYYLLEEECIFSCPAHLTNSGVKLWGRTCREPFSCRSSRSLTDPSFRCKCPDRNCFICEYLPAETGTTCSRCRNRKYLYNSSCYDSCDAFPETTPTGTKSYGRECV